MYELSLLHCGRISLTSGNTEGGPRPTLLRTHNLSGLVGWASAHLQGPSRSSAIRNAMSLEAERPGLSRRSVEREAGRVAYFVKGRILQEAWLLAQHPSVPCNELMPNT